MELFIILQLLSGLVISSLIGLAIGQTRGRSDVGFLLGFLLGPIGWLIILVGPNPKKEMEEKYKQATIQRQFALQQAQLEELRRLQTPARSSGPSFPIPGAMNTIYIAKGGRNLGLITIAEAKRMLDDRRLSLEDLYFDNEANQWLEIAGHPTLYAI